MWTQFRKPLTTPIRLCSYQKLMQSLHWFGVVAPGISVKTWCRMSILIFRSRSVYNMMRSYYEKVIIHSNLFLLSLKDCKVNSKITLFILHGIQQRISTSIWLALCVLPHDTLQQKTSLKCQGRLCLIELHQLVDGTKLIINCCDNHHFSLKT